MSCDCEHTRMAKELDRMRRLAKATARLESREVAIYRKEDGTMGISSMTETDYPIIEIISQY